ncbi:hypothetical protein Sgleb_64180 [Streptomyces glebosus]|uniref:Uncharacterized protein n=1 Tax=Streptomyces glebosus TaxID=249580 RepID=A0A640T770_9ACTN|nr:hypothetical protein Sgleb_64180 [Streptomyces glebosus]GHG58346.1 hypothetical protein GCM10010513_22410 [Streptomyces glebosus]
MSGLEGDAERDGDGDRDWGGRGRGSAAVIAQSADALAIPAQLGTEQPRERRHQPPGEGVEGGGVGGGGGLGGGGWGGLRGG